MSLRPVVLLIEPHEEHLARGRDFLVNDCSGSFDVRSATNPADAREILERAQREVARSARLCAEGQRPPPESVLAGTCTMRPQ